MHLGQMSIDRCQVISDDPEKGLVEQCLLLQHNVSMTKNANKIPGIVREDAERKRGNAVFPFHKPVLIRYLEY